jgi:hypothetical protein
MPLKLRARTLHPRISADEYAANFLHEYGEPLVVPFRFSPRPRAAGTVMLISSERKSAVPASMPHQL